MKRRLGILALVTITAVTVACFIFSTSATSESLPASKKWAKSYKGDIQQLTLIENSIIITRTLSDVYAIDILSGNIIWQQSLAWLFLYKPVMTGKDMLFLSDGTGVLALDQSDGKILWQQRLRHPSTAEVAAVSPNLVAVNDPPYLSVYQTVNGALVWEKSVCRETIQAYFSDSIIIVPCFGLTAYDALSGESVWEIKSDEKLDRIWKSAFADGVIYFSQDFENITAYDVKNRTQLWMSPLTTDRSQAFKVIGEYLAVSKDNQLCVLHRHDGEISWCVNDLIKAKNPVIFEDNLYLFNGLQNGITAYEADNGNQMGRFDFQAYNFITVDNDRQLMVSSDEFLIFANGEKIYAFGK